MAKRRERESRRKIAPPPFFSFRPFSSNAAGFLAIRAPKALSTTKTRHGEGGGRGSREGRKSTRINLVRDYHYDLL